MLYNCTRTGNRKISKGGICEDFTNALTVGNMYDVLVVSDGCGSSMLSSVGSRVTVENVCEVFANSERFINMSNAPPLKSKELFEFILKPGNERLLVQLVIKTVHKAIGSVCRGTDLSPNMFSSTLLMALIKRNSCNNEAVVLSVGDGFAVAGFADQSVAVVSPGENISGCKNRTYFVTSADAIEHIHIYRVRGFQQLLLSTDGLTHALNINNEDCIKRFLISLKNIKAVNSQGFKEGLFSLISDHSLLSDDCGVAYFKDEPDEIDLDFYGGNNSLQIYSNNTVLNIHTNKKQKKHFRRN